MPTFKVILLKNNKMDPLITLPNNHVIRLMAGAAAQVRRGRFGSVERWLLLIFLIFYGEMMETSFLHVGTNRFEVHRTFYTYVYVYRLALIPNMYKRF